MITLRDLNGNERQVPEGRPYVLQPGEVVVHGRHDGTREERQILSTLDKLAASQGIQLGDLIAKLTKVFGIAPCSKCEQRRQVLNKMAQLGIIKAVRLLREI